MMGSAVPVRFCCMIAVATAAACGVAFLLLLLCLVAVLP